MVSLESRRPSRSYCKTCAGWDCPQDIGSGPERDVAANTTQTIKAKWRFRQGSSPAPSISMIAGTCRIVTIFVLRYRGLVHQRLAKRSVAAKHRGLASDHPRKDENTNLD